MLLAAFCITQQGSKASNSKVSRKYEYKLRERSFFENYCMRKVKGIIMEFSFEKYACKRQCIFII